MGLFDLFRKPNSEKPKLSKFECTQLRGRIIQFLETYDILISTKNMETLVSRINFIKLIYKEFQSKMNTSNYLNILQSSVSEYRDIYPHVTFRQGAWELLKTPDNNKLTEFIGASIVICYEKMADEEYAKISTMKQQAAIDKRRENIIRKGYDAKYLFKTLGLNLPDTYLDEIEAKRKLFYQKI